MKFLCEQCKAKYQIADDKVAGKTVKMKCRKCGFMIEVRAEVTETSVASMLPAPPGDQKGQGDPTSPPERAFAPKPAPGAPRPGGPPVRPVAKPLATSLSAAKPPPGSIRPGGAKESPGALAGAFQSSVRRPSEPPGSVAAAVDLMDSSAAAGDWYVAINGVPVGPIRIAELRRKAALGSVSDDSLCWKDGMEEWRPVRAVTELSEVLREAAASGGRSSLTQSDRPASIPPPAPYRASEPRPESIARKPGPQSITPTQLLAPVPGGPGAAPNRPANPMQASPLQTAASGTQGERAGGGAMQATGRSNVVPFTSRLATAEKLEPRASPVPSSLPAPTSVAAPAPDSAPRESRSSLIGPDPFKSPSAPVTTASSPLFPSDVSSPLATSAPGPAPQSFGGAGASTSLVAPSVAPGAPASRRPVPWIPLSMVALAGAFGVTAAVVLFSRPKPVEVIVQAPPPAASAASPKIDDVPPPPPSASAAEAVDAGPVKVATSTGNTGAAKPRGEGPVAAPPTGGGAAPIDLSGLLGSGPKAGPGSNSSSSSGNNTLTQGDVQDVVSQHRAGVQRTCWERGSSARSANVTVHVIVGGSGAVQSATSTGDEPVVAKCIENNVRGWRFPGGGTVDLPFHFVRQ